MKLLGEVKEINKNGSAAAGIQVNNHQANKVPEEERENHQPRLAFECAAGGVGVMGDTPQERNRCLRTARGGAGGMNCRRRGCGGFNGLVAKKWMECCRSEGVINNFEVPGDIKFQLYDGIGSDPAERGLSAHWRGRLTLSRRRGGIRSHPLVPKDWNTAGQRRDIEVVNCCRLGHLAPPLLVN